MQLNSGFKEFSDLNNALSSISDAELQKADVPELQKKTIAASLKVLNQLGSLAHLGNDSETRAAAQSLVGRLKPLLDKSGPASQLANDISSVCTNILSGRPRTQTVSLVLAQDQTRKPQDLICQLQVLAA